MHIGPPSFSPKRAARSHPTASPRRPHEIDRATADDLVGDVELAALRVLGYRAHYLQHAVRCNPVVQRRVNPHHCWAHPGAAIGLGSERDKSSSNTTADLLPSRFKIWSFPLRVATRRCPFRSQSAHWR